MLLSFSVENFRSIKSRQEITFVPDGRQSENSDNTSVAGDRNQYQGLSAVILFGRNASGKSNLLLALRAFQVLVTSSIHTSIGETIRQHSPFLLDYSNHVLPSTFVLDFVAHDTLRYQYMISVFSESVAEESLHVYHSAKPTMIFHRSNADGNSVTFGVGVTGQKNIVKSQLLKNQLALSKGANSNLKALIAPYEFIARMKFSGFDWTKSETVDSIRTDNPFLNFDSSNGVGEMFIAMKAATDPNIIPFLNQLLKAADTSIESLITSYEEKSSDDNGIPTSFTGGISTVHKSNFGPVIFPSQRESDGTRRLLTLGAVIYDAFQDGLLLVVDEIDKSLHPAISRFLVSLFNDSTINLNGAQLVATSHDVTLLDEQLLRRDQIYFVEKERESTEVYRLSDISGVRKGSNISDLYTAGRFGATPRVGIISPLSPKTKK